MTYRLGRWARLALAPTGVLLVFSGVSFFVLPEYAAENFPWSVSPFVAMTIGGWALGMGFLALESFRGWSVSGFAAPLVAVWSFSILQLIVAIAFLPVLRTDHLLTWPYLAALLAGVVSAATGLPWLWSRRAELRTGSGLPMPLRVLFVGFILLTGGLGLATLVQVASGGNVFPEPISAFTTRAFSAFFASLALGTIPILVGNRVELAVVYSRTGLYLLAAITVAAFSFLNVFNFAAKPGQYVYLAAYILAIVVALGVMVAHRAQGSGEGRVAAPRWRP